MLRKSISLLIWLDFAVNFVGGASEVYFASSANGFSVLITGAADFVGSHCSTALKKRGDGVLGLDNFNDYYDPSLKRQNRIEKHHVFIVEGDLNDGPLLTKLLDVVPCPPPRGSGRCSLHHEEPTVLCELQHRLIRQTPRGREDGETSTRHCLASSSSVYGLNTENLFSEESVGSGGKKKGSAQFRVHNLGNSSPVSVGKLVGILEGLLKTTDTFF